jgi:hypothetical protein
MRGFRIERQTVVGTILFLTMAGMIGGYRYIQQQRMNDLQQQINQVPAGKEKASLVKDHIALENTIDGSLVQAVGGLLLFITAYISFQNLKATQRNVLISEEKQVTERFTQAINQLGSEGKDKITIRLGGIYALERIAKDSPKDYWTIMEVLTSFIREKILLSKFAKQTETQSTEAKDSSKSFGSLEPKEQSSKCIATDTEAALIVIGRREAKNDPKDKFIDLSGADFSYTNLYLANLSRMIFVNTNLSKANLYLANLSYTILYITNLSGAVLKEANLSHADLSGAVLKEANLFRTDLSGAVLKEANLSGANLSGANLSGAKGIKPNQIQQAYCWQQAHYDPEFREELGLPPEE